MNCRDFQDELALWFGSELPDDLQAHIQACAECRACRDQLSELRAAMPEDWEFYPSPGESERLSADVMQSLPVRSRAGVSRPLGRRLTETISGLLRPRPLGAAVVSVLLLVAGLWWIALTPDVTTVGSSASVAELWSDVFSEPELYEPEAETVALLVDELTASEPTTTARRILDDLSDEEYQYLAKNLTVKDIL